MPDTFEWAVGLFEGEGCISMRRPNGARYEYVRLTLGSVDFDVVNRFHRVVKVGRIYERPANANRQLCYIWHCQRMEEAQELIEKMYPLLGNRRRAKAREALRVRKQSR
jgi:hypothetical protein